MKSGVTDSGEIPLNNGKKLVFRLTTQGFYPKAIRERLEGIISDSIVTFLRENRYESEQLKRNQFTLTELLELEFGEVESEFPGVIRYSHVVGKGDLTWTIDVHLEGAVAPCRSRLAITEENKS